MSDSPEQLDIFVHSRDVMLRNDVLAALWKRDATAARLALAALADEVPGDPQLAAFGKLIGALENAACVPLILHADLAMRRRALLDEVAPAALQCLGATSEAGPWLAPLWAWLATGARGLAFDARQADDHAAALWLMAGRWDEAVRAVETIASWRRIPVPLAWMLEARCRLGRLDDAWPLLAELAWMAPALLDAWLHRADDTLLRRLHDRFGDEFEGSGSVDDLAWFPAWVLTDTPALAPRLAAAQPSQDTEAERALRLLVELLGFERQGRQHELVPRRRALRDLHPGLFACYLAAR